MSAEEARVVITFLRRMGSAVSDCRRMKDTPGQRGPAGASS